MAVDFSKKKILIIDDFPEMRHSLKRMLQTFGAVQVDDVDSGEKAIEKMELKSYDILLCDYNLGADRKDGQQILEEVKYRKLARYSTIFMMITAENTMEMVLGAVEYKPDDYLTKPFTKEVLKSRLERLIERKSDIEDIEKAVDDKDYQRAVDLCDERINSNPKNAMELYKLKGEVCLAMGDYNAAVAVYDKVLAMRSIPWARMGQAKALFFQEQYGQAKELFESLIEDNRAFVEAYDWLAKTLVELGDSVQAQQVLKRAADLSPKAIMRQKTLGELAYQNRDFDSAENSYKKVINLGKYSYLKDPSDYSGLAKVLVDKEDPDEALKYVEASRKEFDGREDASLQASLMEGVIYQKMNREEDAKKSMADASRLYEKLGDKVAPTVAMDMAKVCFAMGDTEKGKALVQDVVRNHHEDDKLLKQAEDVFKDASLQDEGKQMIESTRKEIIEVNNKGVYLVRDGKLDEAIDYFQKAAEGLPQNRTINMNAAQALLMHMQRNGSNDRFLHQSRQYLERVGRIDPRNEKYQKLLGMYQKLRTSATPSRTPTN